jgi:hypothetical protein
MAKQWICVFSGVSGGHARAVFDSKDHATRFAEQHVRVIAPSGIPMKWEDTASDCRSVLTTQLGNYLVAPDDEQ